MEDAIFVTIGMVAVAAVAWVVSQRWSLWKRSRASRSVFTRLFDLLRKNRA